MIHSYKPEVPEKVIISQVIKTIAAFLNSEGGTLVIGADDDAQPLGIEPDLTARNFDLDRYENFVMTSIVTNIGTVAASQCRVRFEDVNDKTICIVDVRPSTRPVFANTDKGNEVFYIRTGNARALKARNYQLRPRPVWGLERIITCDQNVIPV